MPWRGRRPPLPGALLAALLLAPGVAGAEGFQLERYEPSPAGDVFFAAAHPWYSSARWLAAGLTFDYGHNALLGGTYAGGGFAQTRAIVEHMAVGHLDVAGSFLDRVQVSLSLPLVLWEQGTAGYGAAAIAGVAASDPRLGAMARLWGHAERDPLSVHLGLRLWIPVGGAPQNAGDPSVRALGEVVLAGFAAGWLRWSFGVGVLGRGVTAVGHGPGSGVGSELQLRAGLGWTDRQHRVHVGPEAVLSATITGPDRFTADSTGLELLVGAGWNIARVVQVGAAVGSGVVSTLGYPDVRAVVRLAYAPLRQKLPGDTDGDGVLDGEDLCPREAGARGRAAGCPDQDDDGVADAQDLCPALAGGAHPDKAAPGCPQKDADSDGVPDAEDECPALAPGAHPDPSAHGCPQKDADSDGVPDAEDQCPALAPGAHPDPSAHGCPLPDADRDGVPDAEDACPRAAAGAHPDARRAGCPLPDADSDGVPDAEDACPRLAGPPSAVRAASGCPPLDRSLTELRAVRFETNRHAVLPEGLPVLDELAALLRQHPEVRRVEIAGHADDTGTAAFNLRLSRLRALDVVRHLVRRGVSARRLVPVGYGDTRPLSDDRSDEARARNRRVEAVIGAR